MSGEPDPESPFGTWLPLKSLPHGRVIRNHITTQETRTSNPHSIDLWLGSEVYAFEVFIEDSRDDEGEETWLRGYVLGNPSLVFHPSPKNHPSPNLQPESSVFIGIFPSSCIQWDKPIKALNGSSITNTFEVSYDPNTLRGTLGPPVPASRGNPSDRTTGKDEPNLILHLTRDTVQRWTNLLPTLLTNRNYKLFNQITKEIQWAVFAHEQLKSTILTRAQRNKLKPDVIRRLTSGDQRLGLGVVLRHPRTGRLPIVMRSGGEDSNGTEGGWRVTPLRVYLAEAGLSCLTRNNGTLSKEEERLAELYLNDPGPGIPSLETIRSSIRGPSALDKERTQARLLAQVKATIIPTNPGECLELYLSVYDDSETRRAFVTEEFVYHAMAGGHITEKASVVFDLPLATTQGKSLFLIIKVVRVVQAGGAMGGRRYPFGIAVTPLSDVIRSMGSGRGLGPHRQESVLNVIPWSQDKVFASMHEDLVRSTSFKDDTRHRLVIGMQMISASQTTRHAAIARALSGPNPSLDYADVYIKLWSAMLPEPIPDEVFVKMTLYSTDQHRLVDCLFPGGSGTATEGELEYKSILWQKSSTARHPVFGDLVRFRTTRDMLETGFIRFSIVAVDRGVQTGFEQGGNETIVFSAELPLCRTPGQELWLEDGEHTLVPAQQGCALTIRSLALVPFGFRDSNIAYVLQQEPNDISVDRIELLTYAPADELEKHAKRLVDHLLSAMLGDAANAVLHSAVLDVLARLASTVDLGTDAILPSQTVEKRALAACLLLETISTALKKTAQRNGIIKATGLLLRVIENLSENSESQTAHIALALDAFQVNLLAISSARDDPIGHTLTQKHWPFSSYPAPEDAIKLIDFARAETVAEQKAKLGMMMRALDELSPDDSLIAALWRNTKGLLRITDRDRMDVLQLGVSLIARITDRILLEGDSLVNVLDYIGTEALRTLISLFNELSGGFDRLDRSELPITSRLAVQVIQQSERVRLSLIVADIRACIMAITLSLGPRIGELLMDLEEEEAVAIQNAAWIFFEAVSKESSQAAPKELLPRMEIASWMGLCRAIYEREWSAESTTISISPVIALVGRYAPAESFHRHPAEETESDAVACLEHAWRGRVTPASFVAMVDLAMSSQSSKVRQVCHQIILEISFGGPNIEIEAFLMLLVQAFTAGSHRIAQITTLVEEASTVWLTEGNGWGAALEILPLLYDALENTSCIQPLSAFAYLSLLDLVIPFPAVKKALVERLYRQVFEIDGASTANLLLDLALLCHDPNESFSLRLHGHATPVELRAAELHEASVNEAMRAGDLGLAARILASLTVVAEREGDYQRMSQVLTYRSKLARMMQESSPVWHYFLVRYDQDEPMEIIWRARSSVELLCQVQQAFPQCQIALREGSDYTPIPAEIDVKIYQVEIEDTPIPNPRPPTTTTNTPPPTPLRPLWAKTDNPTCFTRDLMDGDLEIYTLSLPFPGIFPFSRVKRTGRVVQTEEEVVVRKIKRGTEELLEGLDRVVGCDDLNGLSDLLDTSLDNPIIQDNLNTGYSTLIIPFLSLIERGLGWQERWTRGTPLEVFHKGLVERYEGRFPDVLRERAGVGVMRVGGREGGLLGAVFDRLGSDGVGGRGGRLGKEGDRPSEETLVHGQSGTRSISPFTRKMTSRRSDESGVAKRVVTGDALRPGSAMGSSSMRIPIGLKRLGSIRLGSILGGTGRRRGSEGESGRSGAAG